MTEYTTLIMTTSTGQAPSVCNPTSPTNPDNHDNSDNPDNLSMDIAHVIFTQW